MSLHILSNDDCYQSSPSPSFITLLCYLLPIGLTLTHCSLTFCQTWFLTSDLYILFFLLCCHAVSPSPQSCLSPFSISPLLAACEFSKRFFGDPIFPFPSSLLTFLALSICACLVRVLFRNKLK